MSNKELIETGRWQEHWSAAGNRILKYSVEVSHKGLKEYKIITAPDMEFLRNKLNVQVEKWQEKWEKLESKRLIDAKKEANQDEANTKTRMTQEQIEQIEQILMHTLSIDDNVDWDSLKRYDEFPSEKPRKPRDVPAIHLPEKPAKELSEFLPQFSIIEKLIKVLKEKKEKQFELKYKEALAKWEKQKDEIEKNNLQIESDNLLNVEKWGKEVEEWERQKELFELKQSEYNDKIEKLKAAYLSKDTASIVEYCEMVLNNSEYLDSFPKNFELEYNPANEILIVEYQLPSLECFPKIKEVKYNASNKELKEYYLSDTQVNKMFDEAIYKIALRTIHELFEADAADALKAVSFNGWVNAINRATGKEENNCIISIQTMKEEFMQIELANVDPKACFKNLKGVASSKLSSITPIKPILQINREDRRFIDSYNVADTLDDTTNVAAMDWEDFEHLIREIFAKEFSSNGGEVKVTQASRDGGVDAIAFDPDPLRGGKIVIQAKRYTNTVGVSAVRDLFGTVVNEGATKGILVTTADYGPDAYEFAKDKPLTLLNGSNLLHLLGKHGIHAKIDLTEAKIMLSEKEK